MKFSHAARLITACLFSGGSVFCVLNLVAAPTQDYMVKTWGVDEGLPESSVSDVVQTPDGYLWVGTLNSGVSRFDGVRFVNFDLPFAANFPSHGVRRLFVDAAGVLWLNGFGNYLASLRDGEFRLEPAEPVVINWLVLSRSGQVVFATKEGRLLDYSTVVGTNVVSKTIPAPGAGLNTRFYADGEGHFWYRRTDGQIARLVNGAQELMSPTTGNPHFSALAGDSLGRIAIVGGGGVVRLGKRRIPKRNGYG